MKNVFLLIVFFALLTGCTYAKNQDSSVVKIAGSTSVAPIVKKIKEKFEEKYPNINIEIQETGSSSGITSVIQNVADIGMSSRALKPEELEKLSEITIALDGICVIINPNNKINNLNENEISKIFAGEITNWKQLGGDDIDVVVLSREEGSGTRTAFEQLLNLEQDITRNGKKYKSSIVTLDALYQNSTGAIKKYISSNTNAIGYVSLGNLDDSIKAISINGVKPSEKSILNNEYVVSRSFVFCQLKDNNNADDANIFIDYILSAEGQQIISDNNYIKAKN